MKGRLLNIVSMACNIMLLVTIGLSQVVGAAIPGVASNVEPDNRSGRVSMQSRIVVGKVTSGEDGSDYGNPLPGVNVLIKGTAIGTVTDVNGEYRLEISSDEAVLVFSYVGYITEEVRVGTST